MDRLKKLQLEIEKLKAKTLDYDIFIKNFKKQVEDDTELTEWIHNTFK